MNHFWNTALLGAALIIPVALAPATLRAEDNHQATRSYSDFAKLKDNDQQRYWAWRHQHSDAQLKIEVR